MSLAVRCAQAPEVEHSRCVAQAAPVALPEAALRFVDALKARPRDATRDRAQWRVR